MGAQAGVLGQLVAQDPLRRPIGHVHDDRHVARDLGRSKPRAQECVQGLGRERRSRSPHHRQEDIVLPELGRHRHGGGLGHVGAGERGLIDLGGSDILAAPADHVPVARDEGVQARFDFANAVAGPMGDKLALRSGEEILSKEMMLQGILSIQAGDNPRATQEKMLAFIPNSVRRNLKLAA